MYGCQRCKCRFEGEEKLAIHECSAGVSTYHGSPRLRLQNLPDEILRRVATFLPLNDLVKLIELLPKLQIVHGFNRVWLQKYTLRDRRLDRQDYNFQRRAQGHRHDNNTLHVELFVVSLQPAVRRYLIDGLVRRAALRVSDKDLSCVRRCRHCRSCAAECVFKKRRFQLSRKIDACESRFNCCG
jgi:hypothetical protein